MTQELTKTNGGAVAEYGVNTSDALGAEVSTLAETSTRQLEAQARALIQARFFIAKQPQMQRSWDQVEQRLRKECARPGFAHSAWWILPLGNNPQKYPQGLSIRFAEAALRMAGNIDVQMQTVFDDEWKRIVRITVMDLETNFAYTSEATIDKTVERRDAKDRQVLATRQNSEGRIVHVVAATEQEIALKQGSAVSKAIRTQGLRLIPGDILDECKTLIMATRAKGSKAEDPEAARKAILDNFAEIGVMPDDIIQFLGHKLETLQPAERDVLRGLFRAIRDGQTTWQDVMAEKDPAGTKEAAQAVAAQKLASLRKQADKESAGSTPATEAGSSGKATEASTGEHASPQSGNQPPADLPDHSEWPDSPTGKWIKVGGAVYCSPNDDGNYLPWGGGEKKSKLNLGGKR